MIKFICNQFELDITASKPSFIVENFWFKDSLFSEYTLPASLYLSESVRQDLQMYFHQNQTDFQTIFDGMLFRDGQLTAATFEVQEINDKVLKYNVLVKNNDISTWKRKLSALNLINFELPVGETIVTHANGIVNQSFPDVNYNFPMLYTERYNTDDATFAYFKKYINYFESGNFVENEIDTTNNIIYNRNIMQPMPYLLYVLQQGFLDAGYVLVGDVLTDPELQKALIVAVVDYFNTSDQNEIPLTLNYDNFDSLYQHSYNGQNYTMALYYKEEEITHVGRYRIVGRITMQYAYMANEKITIKYGDDILYQADWPGVSHGNHYIDIDISFDATSIDLAAGKKVSVFVEDALAVIANTKIDLNINPIRYHNIAGDASDVIYMPSEVNLKRTVPDMEFGELVKIVMNWKNFDLNIQGSKVEMNYISSLLMTSDAVDLNHLSNSNVNVKFNKDLSFEFRFADNDIDPSFAPSRIYIDRYGAVSNNYEKKSTTKEVLIDMLPLPKIQNGNIVTSYIVGDDESRLYVAFYEGLSDIPAAIQLDDAVFPAVFEKYLSKWFFSQINTSTFLAEADIPSWRVDDIKMKRLVYMYDNYFIVKKLEKERTSVDFYHVKLTLEKLI